MTTIAFCLLVGITAATSMPQCTNFNFSFSRYVTMVPRRVWRTETEKSIMLKEFVHISHHFFIPKSSISSTTNSRVLLKFKSLVARKEVRVNVLWQFGHIHKCQTKRHSLLCCTHFFTWFFGHFSRRAEGTVKCDEFEFKFNLSKCSQLLHTAQNNGFTHTIRNTYKWVIYLF